MKSLIEEENILTFGKKQIDVSNVAYGRIEYAIREWNKLRETDFTEEIFDNLCEDLGLYMIKQDFDVLRLRLPFVKAVKSYIKRMTLNKKHIKKLNRQNHDDFIDWVYFVLTGDKKKDLLTEEKMIKMATAFYEQGEMMGKTHEECATLLWTFLQDQTKPSGISTKDLNQS